MSRIVTWIFISAMGLSAIGINDYRINALPEGGEIVTVCSIHEDTYYRVTGDGMGFHAEPPSGYPAFAEVTVRDNYGNTYTLELDGLEFSRSISVGDELIGIRSVKGGIANLERRK